MEWLQELVGLGNPQFHTRRWVDGGKKGYKRIEGTITRELIAGHLTGGECSLGMYLNCAREEGGTEEMARCLVLDFDDHDGSIDPGLMKSRVGAVVGVLLSHGVPHFVVQSGGGRGYHVWLVYENARRDDSLREDAKELLEAASETLQEIWPNESFIGTREAGRMFVRTDQMHSSSDRGDTYFKEHFIETIPKGKGRQNIAVPLGRKSVLMKGTLKDDGFAALEPHPEPENFKLEYIKKKKPGPKSSRSSVGKVDRDAAFDALVSKLDVNHYDDWIRVAMRLIAAFGLEDEWAFDRWLNWSKTGNFQQGDEKKWSQCRDTRISPITFWLDAKKAGYTGGSPFKPAEERRLIALSFLDDVRLLRDEVGIPYAQISERRFVSIKSEAFHNMIVRGLHEEKEIFPSDEMVKAVQSYGCALAEKESREPVHLRFAARGDKRYLHLADDDDTVIEIDAAGWRIVDCDVPVFRRGDGLPLPMPVKEEIGNVLDLINIDRENFSFVLAWILTAMYAPSKQCPILLLDGIAGTGKSSALKTIIRAIDPKVGFQSGTPRSEDDLFAAAYGGAVVSFDNVSTLGKLSDPLCRLSTGGGLRKRKLYTDSETYALDAMRPVLVAGIDPTMYQQDLIERVVRVELFKPGEYLDDGEFDRKLDEMLPRFSGALLGLLSTAIRMAPEIKGETRFGTFVRMGECAARALGFDADWFTRQYQARLLELSRESAEADSVVIFLHRYLSSLPDRDERGKMIEKAGKLWEIMQQEIRDGQISLPADDVPRNARAMGSRIQRAATVLDELYGIRVSRGPRREFIFVWDGRTKDSEELLSFNPEQHEPPF